MAFNHIYSYSYLQATRFRWVILIIFAVISCSRAFGQNNEMPLASTDTLHNQLPFADSLDIQSIPADSLGMSGDTLLSSEDTTSLYGNVTYTKKELKRMHRDSVWKKKDSIIRATPRLLTTYYITGNPTKQRMFVWNNDSYFNKPELIENDTSYNAHFHELPYLQDDVGATYLGVAGSAMMSFNFFKRSESDVFPFFSPYMPYTYTRETMPFYNTKTPYTELAYWGTLLANKQKEETNIKFLHTQNFTPSFNFNILYKRIGGNGILDNESTDNRTFSLTGNYLGERYTAHFGYIFNRIKRNENGGVSDVSMVLDTIIDARTIPVYLSDASTKVKSNTVFLTHSYGIPIRFGKKGDSLAVGEGTMAYLGHTFEYSTYSKVYTDAISLTDSVGRSLYENYYVNPTASADSARVMNLENRLFISLQPWAREAIVSKIEGGIGYQLLSYYNFNPNFYLTGNESNSAYNLYLYFGASGQLKKYLHWNGFGKYNISGRNSSDFKIRGDITFSAYPLPRGIHLTGKILIAQQRPDYFYENYYSNHYAWSNNFNKTTETTVEARLNIPDYKLEAGFGYSMLKDNIYLDEKGIARQNGSAMSVLSVWARKDLRLWKFHMENKALFQISSKEEVVPLPKLALNLRYYLQFDLVRNVLQAQLGVDATFSTKYYMPAYSPALGLFFNQQAEQNGGTPYLDVFLNLQWKRACIFVKGVNIAQNWPDNDYFSANRYLRPQKALKFGLFWPFYIK